MVEIIQTETFSHWLSSLRDSRAKQKIAIRIRRLSFGNAGDVKPVGEGVSELRIDEGKGYRVYYVQHGKALIVLLCGGSKARQQADIEQAKRMAREISGGE